MRIALDFDGVLHSYAQGFTGATDLPGAPVKGAREWCQAAINAGHELVIYSCRARSARQAAETDAAGVEWDSGGADAMRAWLRKHDFPHIEVTGTKPAAYVYLDDRAITFRGTWPTLDKLTRFRPWEQDALGGFVGAKDRPQEILTPAGITDVVRAVFGGPVRMDPCAARDARETVKATIKYYGPPGPDGLVQTWIDYTFVNPPFGSLKAWLEKSLDVAGTGVKLIVLAPVRSRRPWWRIARSRALELGAYVELNDVTFIGYPNVYPESLGLFVFNLPVDRVVQAVAESRIGAVL